MDVILQARGLGYSWPKRGPVFERIELALPAGQVMCILGPNGVGKSTLLACLCGLLRPEQGEVHLSGRPIAGLGQAEIARDLAFVPQTQASVFDFTLRTFVELGRAAHLRLFQTPGAADRKIVDEVLERLGIADLAEKTLTEVSGGERQLATIARALVQKPKIVVLDEPAAHLDFANQARLLQVIDELRLSGLSVLFTTHIPDHAYAVATTTMVLSRHTAPMVGATQDLLDARTLTRIYETPIEVLSSGHGRHAALVQQARVTDRADPGGR